MGFMDLMELKIAALETLAAEIAEREKAEMEAEAFVGEARFGVERLAWVLPVYRQRYAGINGIAVHR